MATCDISCQFDAPEIVGDAAAVITIRSGSPGIVDGLTIFAEGCDAGYNDVYSDSYSDPTQGGLFPSARVTDTSYTISAMPPNSTLVIDAVERRVTLTDSAGRIQVNDVDVLEWTGLFEWIEAAKGGCQALCVDVLGADTNIDTTVEISFYEREV